jgi:hypothetical protein
MTTPDEFTAPQPSGTASSWVQFLAELRAYFVSNVITTGWSALLFAGGMIFLFYFFSILYRSTVFWTPSDLKLSCSRQGTLLLVSHLGGCFVSMPPNQPGLIVLTLKLVQRQAEFFHRIKGLEP